MDRDPGHWSHATNADARRPQWETSSRRWRLRCSVVVTLLILCSSGVFAGTRIPYRGVLRHQIEELFLVSPVPDGSDAVALSFEKLTAYEKFIRKKRRFVLEHVRNYEIRINGRSDEQAQRIAAKRDLTTALGRILELLEELAAENDPGRIFELAAEIITIEYATRSYTDPIGSVKIPIHLKNMAIDWSAPRHSRPKGASKEAGNLVDPETGAYFTTAELRKRLEDGEDLSLLDPPDTTPAWRAKEDIGSVDVVRNYLEANDPVHEGLRVVFPSPDGAHFHFEKSHTTQSKPKLDVYYLDERCAEKKRKKQKSCRLRYKLKFGMETHADPVANSLLAALGFNVDVSMHLKRVRVYLGDKTLHELEADWSGYFDRQRTHTYVPLRSVLFEGEEGHGFDEQGEYIVFREAVAELKFPEIERIGFFAFREGIAAENREIRGLFVFNAWIANADMKDEENNKVSLRKDEDGIYRTYMTQQDMGHALGLVLPERPDAFPWDVVETSLWSRAFGALHGRIELNYLDLQTTALEDTATFADVRWMTRLIAQLSRGQIADAVALGRWPGGIGELYTEKLINRRNQLVEAFGLSDEFDPLPVDRKLTTPDGSVVNGELIQNRFEDSSIQYDDHWSGLLVPMASFIGEGLLGAALAGIGAVDLIDPGEVHISGRVSMSPDILIKLSRLVTLNPRPTGGFDQFIVHDTLALGVRPRIGYVGNVQATAYRKVAIAYPAPTRMTGLKGNNAALMLLTPGVSRFANLPEKFVLYREDTVGGGLLVKSNDADVMDPFGIDVSGQWLVARRSIIDHRDETPRVWIDRPNYFDTEIRAYLNPWVLEIPFYLLNHTEGSVAAKLFDLDPERLDVRNDDDALIYDRVVTDGDYRDIDSIAKGEPELMTSVFDVTQSRLNLYVANALFREREDRIAVGATSGRARRQEYQVERRRMSKWTFFDNGEQQALRIRGTLGALEADGRPTREPFVVVGYAIDDRNTHSDELTRYYELLASLKAGEDILPAGFDGSDWEVSREKNGRWARMLVGARVILYAEALDRLLDLDADLFWERLAERLDVGLYELERLRRNIRSPKPAVRNRARLSPLGRHAHTAVHRSVRVLRHLRKAREAENEEEQLHALVRALDSANFRRSTTYDATVLANLLEVIDAGELAERGALAIRSQIHKAFEDENNLPERREIVGAAGIERDLHSIDFPLFPTDGVELYNALDWAAEAP